MTTTPQQAQALPSAGTGDQQSTPPPRRRRRWPWIVGGVFAALVVIGNVVDEPQPVEPVSAPAAPAPAAPPAAPVEAPAAAPAPAPVVPAPAAAVPAPPAAHPVVLPNVAGRNGQIVFEQLTALGLTNFTMASQDIEDKLVLFPANWTAVSVEPGPGETVMSNATVIVTMTKQ